jgi:Amt family ammonium transporter
MYAMNRNSRIWKRLVVLAVATLVLGIFGTSIVIGQDEVAAPSVEDFLSVSIAIDTVWVMISSIIVFFMQAGFAMLEAGVIRQKGVVNALLENFVDAAVTAICWWLIGFGLAFGTSSGGLFGTSLFMPGVADMDASFGSLNLSVMVMFFFQFAFAATAATIATGAMAERTDFVGDLIYTVVIAVFIYPIVVHWIWGGGWIAGLGFHDFAGSTVVHTTGGIIALIGAWMLGPRVGRVWGSMPRPHNLGMATLGTMILWFGWYGFNAGSTLGAVGYGGLIGIVAVNTTLAAATGAVTAMFIQFFRTRKWDLGWTLNGSLAGLVAVTAGCAFVSPLSSLIIGVMGAIVLIIAIEAVEKVKIDDAVGAFAVHGACGILGTLAVGLFAESALTFNGEAGLFNGGGLALLGVQATGSLATVAFVGVSSVIMFGALKAIGKLRVSSKADVVGIDIYEHGASLWPDVLPFPEDDIAQGKPGVAATSPAVGD